MDYSSVEKLKAYNDMTTWDLSKYADAPLELFQRYIDAGANINGLPDSKPPIIAAAEKQNLPVIEILIAAGANVNAQGYNRKTPLHVAIEKENLAIIQALIAAGANVNAQNHTGKTPLHLAIAKDNLAIIQALITAGANLNAQNNDGRTPLHVAALRGRKPIIHLLLKSGIADPFIKDLFGKTALSIFDDYPQALEARSLLQHYEEYYRENLKRKQNYFMRCLQKERMVKRVDPNTQEVQFKRRTGDEYGGNVSQNIFDYLIGPKKPKSE